MTRMDQDTDYFKWGALVLALAIAAGGLIYGVTGSHQQQTAQSPSAPLQKDNQIR